MNTKITFCEECRAEVAYSTVSLPMTGTIKDKAYHYVGQEAHCSHCGSVVYVPEILDANLQELYRIFREENGIISLEMIRAIPEKYAIGKRPLSLLLGWGEQTFSRYWEGDLPTRQYSDMLLRLYHNPQTYAELLEANQGNLKSPHTYQKSRRAVDALLTCSQSDNRKIDSVIQYLLNQCGDITPLALQKALYYIQGFHYAFYRTFLFAEDCQAWVHGPVYQSIYLRYRDYRFDPIRNEPVFDASVFSPEERAIFDSIIRNICCYSGKILEQFTHQEDPWRITRADLPPTAPSNKSIGKTLIGDYFSAVKERYAMESPGDIRLYTQDLFRKTGLLV